MSSIILLFLCLFLGILVRVFKIFPKETPSVLNQFLIYISLPAMALYYLPKVKISYELLFPLGVAWIGFGVAALLFIGLGKLFKWSRSLTGCLILTAGLGNTSFVGIPVIEALYGKEGLKTLILVDLPGTFMVLSTLGILVAATYSRGRTNLKELGFRIVKFPPFIAFCIGVCMTILSLNFPDVLNSVFEKLALTITPLALVSVGYQLKIEKKSKHWKFLGIGLFYQLMIWPAIIFLLYKYGFNQSGIQFEVSVMEAAMAPMITAAIVSASYGLKPKLSSMMVGIGIPLSFLTLAFWYWILQIS
ncbi:AEC family transporter [Moheibacter stercoris]|uniref:Permease n=1 Tax=Moheibacter stercoris TaxID=1628251 RepID=A0ABV2LW97_9FLAO